jgi:TPR repeat protein
MGLAHRGDEKGAFIAFLAAAEEGYPPAQRRLGEIYDSGNAAVERNYAESIRWYQKAREGGEEIPSPKKIYDIYPRWLRATWGVDPQTVQLRCGGTTGVTSSR